MRPRRSATRTRPLAALAPMRVPVSAGGVGGSLDGGWIPEEYPTDPSIPCAERCDLRGLGSLRRRRRARRGRGRRARARGNSRPSPHRSTASTPDRGRATTCSRIRSRASPSPMYHRLHINQLRAMAVISDDQRFSATADRFERYAALPGKPRPRLRPQDRLPPARAAQPLARPSPAVAPPGHPMSDVLALCYHAVSRDWRAGSRSRPDRIERQVAGLLDRGYVGATFRRSGLTAACRADAVGDLRRCLPVRVRQLAAPCSTRLGVPGTVFVPTRPVGSERPMAWPGIDRWLGGPVRARADPDVLGRARRARGGTVGARIAHTHASAAADA